MRVGGQQSGIRSRTRKRVVLFSVFWFLVSFFWFLNSGSRLLADEDNVPPAAMNIPAGASEEKTDHKTAKPLPASALQCPYQQISSAHFPGYTPKNCWALACKPPFTIRHFLIAACREKKDGTVENYQGPNDGALFSQYSIDGADVACKNGLLIGPVTFKTRDAGRFPFLDMGLRLEDVFAHADVYEKTSRILVNLRPPQASHRPNPACLNEPLEGEGFSDGTGKLLQDNGKTTVAISLDKTVFYQPDKTTTLSSFYRKDWERQCAGAIFPGIEDRSRHGKYVVDVNGLIKTIDYYCCGTPIGWHWDAERRYGVVIYPRDITDLYPGANVLTPGSKKGIGYYLGLHLSDGAILKKLEEEHLISGGDDYHYRLQNAFLACRAFSRAAFTKMPEPADERWKSHER